MPTYGLQFDGSNDYVSIPLFTATDDFSISLTFTFDDATVDMLLGHTGTISNQVHTKVDGSVWFDIGGTAGSFGAFLVVGEAYTLEIYRIGEDVFCECNGYSTQVVNSNTSSFNAIGRYFLGQNALTIMSGLSDWTNGTDIRQYDFNQSTGSVLPDSVGSQDGTLTNFPVDDSQWVDLTVYGLQFDGVDDYVSIPTFSTSGDFSISLTFKYSNVTQDDCLIGRRTSFDQLYTRTNGDCKASISSKAMTCVAGLVDGETYTVVLSRTGGLAKLEINGFSDTATGTGLLIFDVLGNFYDINHPLTVMSGLSDWTDGTDIRQYDFNQSTGSVLPDLIGSQDGTLTDFPGDDSQWVELGGGGGPITHEAALIIAASLNQSVTPLTAFLTSIVLGIGLDDLNATGADLDGAVTLNAALDNPAASTADFNPTLALDAGLSESPESTAVFNSAVALNLGLTKTAAVAATLNGTLNLGFSGGLSTNTQWVANAVLALVAELGDSYTYGSILGADLLLGVGAGYSPTGNNSIESGLSLNINLTQNQTDNLDWAGTLTLSNLLSESFIYGAIQSADLTLGINAGYLPLGDKTIEAALTLNANLNQLGTNTTDWAGDITLAAQLTDTTTATGVFDASISLNTSSGDNYLPGLTFEEQIQLGAALNSALGAIILGAGDGDPFKTFIIESQNRSFTVAVELRSFKITKD